MTASKRSKFKHLSAAGKLEILMDFKDIAGCSDRFPYGTRKAILKKHGILLTKTLPQNPMLLRLVMPNVFFWHEFSRFFTLSCVLNCKL